MFALNRAQVFVANYFRKQCWSFLATRAPDNITSGGCVPFAARLHQPGIEEFVPLAISANAESFEIPPIPSGVLNCELAPERRRLRR